MGHSLCMELLQGEVSYYYSSAGHVLGEDERVFVFISMNLDHNTEISSTVMLPSVTQLSSRRSGL